MITEVILPKLGQTMESGTIAEWLVQEGQPVKKGEPIFTVESDKAVLEATAPASGILRRILLPKGQAAPVLSLVGLIGEATDDIGAYEPGARPAATTAGTAAAVGTSTASEPASETSVEKPVAAGGGERVFASPRARRLARLEGVALDRVKGSGPDGRIVEKDVADYIASQPKATAAAREVARGLGIDLAGLAAAAGQRVTGADVLAAAGAVAPGPAAAPVSSTPREAEDTVECLPMSGARAITAQRMLESSQTTAAFTLTTEVDASRLVAWRAMLKARAREGERLPSYTDMLVLLVAKALNEHPALNATLEGSDILRHRQAHIGIAVDTERSLLVPVLRDAGSRSLAEIAAASADLIARARAGQLLPDEMKGGTFTITNLGIYDIDAFTPIINVPECAILGVGRIKERPVVVEGAVVVRPIVVLSLTIDHRAVDGAPAARFLQRLKALIEEPLLAL